MKTMLMFTSLAFCISGTALAREVTESPTIVLHANTGSRAAQLNGVEPGSNTLCRLRYITNTNDDGSKTTRKSVDCDE